MPRKKEELAEEVKETVAEVKEAAEEVIAEAVEEKPAEVHCDGNCCTFGTETEPEKAEEPCTCEDDCCDCCCDCDSCCEDEEDEDDDFEFLDEEDGAEDEECCCCRTCKNLFDSVVSFVKENKLEVLIAASSFVLIVTGIIIGATLGKKKAEKENKKFFDKLKNIRIPGLDLSRFS